MARQQKSSEETSIARPTPGFPSSPFSLMRRLSDEMERLFDGGGIGDLRGSQWWPTSLGTGSWSPDIDIYERKGQLVIHADVPGLTKNDVKVEVSDGELVIEGERKMEQEDKENGSYRRECAYGAFRRALRLPEGVKADRAKATFKDGVLEVTMPAQAHQKKHGRRLKIEAS